MLVLLRAEASFGGFGESQLSQPSSSDSNAFTFDCLNCSGAGFLPADDTEGVDDWASGEPESLRICPFPLVVPNPLPLNFWVSDTLGEPPGENTVGLYCWPFVI